MSGWGEVVTGHSGKGGRTTRSTGNLMYKAVARLEGGLDPWVIRLSLQAEGSSFEMLRPFCFHVEEVGRSAITTHSAMRNELCRRDMRHPA